MVSAWCGAVSSDDARTTRWRAGQLGPPGAEDEPWRHASDALAPEYCQIGSMLLSENRINELAIYDHGWITSRQTEKHQILLLGQEVAAVNNPGAPHTMTSTSVRDLRQTILLDGFEYIPLAFPRIRLRDLAHCLYLNLFIMRSTLNPLPKGYYYFFWLVEPVRNPAVQCPTSR